MDSLLLKKAIFYPTEVVIIRKKGNITIPVADIETISYHEPTLFNYLLPGGYPPKLFEIKLKREINGEKIYRLVVGHKDILKLQEFFQFKISFF